MVDFKKIIAVGRRRRNQARQERGGAWVDVLNIENEVYMFAKIFAKKANKEF